MAPATKERNLEMTNVNSTDLIALKLAVINYHEEANEYLKNGIARDACYTSFNSLKWKREQMADTAAEIKELLPERGQEIADVKLAKLLDKYENMEAELDTLTERHEADKAVYKQIVGEEWTARPKRTYTSKGLGIDDRLKKFA
jgi:hypothetical protein